MTRPLSKTELLDFIEETVGTFGNLVASELVYFIENSDKTVFSVEDTIDLLRKAYETIEERICDEKRFILEAIEADLDL